MNFEMQKPNWTCTTDSLPKIGEKVLVVDNSETPPNRIKWSTLKFSEEEDALYWTFSSNKYENTIIPVANTNRISHWCPRIDNDSYYAEDNLVLPDGVGLSECDVVVPYFILINGQESKTEYFDLTGVETINENAARQLINMDIDGYWEDSSDEFMSLVNRIRHTVYSYVQQSKGVPRSAVKLMYPIFKDDYCERVGRNNGETE